MAFPAHRARRRAPHIFPPACAGLRRGSLPRRVILFALAAVLALAAAAPSSASGAAPRSLDRARVHGLYREGEFEKLVRELAPYGKGECSCSREDSVFAEKHLAVVLAANPATRELGRYHMFRLLDLAPRSDLLDMYVGEEVDAVFEKVRKEHALRAADPAPAAKGAVSFPAKPIIPPAGSRSPAPAPSRPPAVPDPIPDPSAAPSIAVSAPKAFSEAWTRPDSPAAPALSHAANAGRPAGMRIKPPAAKASRSSAPSRAYSPWDQAAGAASAPAANASLPAPRASGTPAGASGVPEGMAKGNGTASGADTSRSAWKEPGLWIGGGAALAAIAFTLWHAGSDDSGPGKTYAVPATLSK